MTQLLQHLQGTYPQVPKDLSVSLLSSLLMGSPQGPAWGLSYRPGEQQVSHPVIQMDASMPKKDIAPVLQHELGHQLEALLIHSPARAKEFIRITGMQPLPGGEDGPTSKWGLPRDPQNKWLDYGGVKTSPLEYYANVVARQFDPIQKNGWTKSQQGTSIQPGNLPGSIVHKLVQSGLIPLKVPFL